MLTLVTDPSLSLRLIEQRQASGSDHHDEVWEDIYLMTPLPNNEHQELVFEIGFALREVVMTTQLGSVLPGTNLTDRHDDWTKNYRCPDVAVFMNESKAENRGTHWVGGPDFVVEIVSPDDKTREKIPFYEEIGTRELLIVDRDPWQLELLRLQDGKLVSVGASTVENSATVASEVLPLSFCLAKGEKRPKIDVRHTDGEKTWCI